LLRETCSSAFFSSSIADFLPRLQHFLNRKLKLTSTVRRRPMAKQIPEKKKHSTTPNRLEIAPI